MTSWPDTALQTARSLRRHAIIAGALVVGVLLIAPIAANGVGFASPLAWVLLIATGFSALALAVHLLFDALLFRLAASYEREASGLEAIDDILSRMGLRQKPGDLRPMAARIAGSRRILWLLWGVTISCLFLFAICLIDMTD